MAGWDGSGNVTRNYNWVAEKNAEHNITASKFDEENNTFAESIAACIAKNGENAATADLPMGNNKHTGVADGSAESHYPSIKQVQACAFAWGGSSGGAANVQTLTLTPAPTTLLQGTVIRFVAGFTNTAACTMNVNALGAAAIQYKGAALTGGEIVAGRIYELVLTGAVGATWKLMATDWDITDVSFRATTAAAQTLTTATLTTAVFGTETYDIGSNFAANTFTAPVTGKYNFSAGGQFAADATGGRILHLYKNGSDRVAQAVMPTNSATVSTDLCVSCDVNMTAADTMIVRVYQDSGGNLDFGGAGQTWSFFSGHLVSIP